MSENITPEQLAGLLDRKGTANDARHFNGLTFDQLVEILESSMVTKNTDRLGGYRLEDFYAMRERPFIHTPDTATFAGLSAEGLETTLTTLVNTRTFQGARLEPAGGRWTHLVSVEVLPDREDFVFGLFGGGINDASIERPVAIMRLGVEGRQSEVLVLSGQYEGRFVTFNQMEGDTLYTEVWYEADSRGELLITCVNSTRAHKYGAAQQTVDKVPSENLIDLSYETALLESTFQPMVEALRQELSGLKTKLSNLKNNC